MADRIHTTDSAAIHVPHRTSVSHCNLKQKDGPKPSGLWWAVGSEWIDWCGRESYGCGKNTFRLVVDDSQLLIIGRDMSLKQFDQKYGNGHLLGLGRYSIDWARVAQQYAGIEIPVYAWDRRLDFMWYYGWDVASGCLWGYSALMSAEAIERNEIVVDAKLGSQSPNRRLVRKAAR